MPYQGETPALSFAGIHTACISGDNGAGKSSIIDAITWALWGKARASGNDELIHQGTAEMEVEFDFLAGGQLYRIIRKHNLPRSQKVSGQGSLDLLICHQDDFIPISGDSKTQTGDKISGLLHMDYETFVNSAYLRQSHADEFTRQAPAKRKEVLASILSLEVYDGFEKEARDRARSAAQEKLRLGTNLSELELEIKQKPLVCTQLETERTQLEVLEAELRGSEAAGKALGEKLREMEAAQARYEQLSRSVSQHQTDLQRENKRCEQWEKRVAEFSALAAGKTAIEAGFAAFTRTRAAYELSNQQARQLYRLKERAAEQEKTILQAQSKMNADHQVCENHINQLETQAKRLPGLTEELKALEPLSIEAAQLEGFIKAERQSSQAVRSRMAARTAEISRLKQAVSEIDERLKMLAECGLAAACPLCETELGEDKVRLVREKYARERQEKSESITRLNQETEADNRRLKISEDEITRFESEHRQKSQKVSAGGARLEQAIKEVREAAARLETERKTLAEIEQRLARKDYAAAEQAALGILTAEIEGLKYDDRQHEALRLEMETGQRFEEQKRRLDEALRLLPAEQETLNLTRQSLLELETRLKEAEREMAELTGQLAELPQLRTQFKAAEAERQVLSERRKALTVAIGRLEQRLSDLTAMETKLQDRRRQLEEVCRDESVYEQLAAIFGKKGIQGILIETALPEIEEEANRLLSRMTDNRMSLTFETRKSNKKGDTAETLDILIADELGTRDYNLFSGGEAFRIDFSIRIALSKLLARRAGAPLPTLIIDEGFGTQDADGIEKLKQAIKSIQDDFQKIIVITHIEELKDAFPSRINVVKRANGSVIEVS